jgi:hypothetical protein
MAFNYGGRIGMASIIKGVQFVCRIYGVYQAKIIDYVNSSTLTTEQKSTVIDWLNLATAVCGLLTSIQVVYE